MIFEMIFEMINEMKHTLYNGSFDISFVVFKSQLNFNDSVSTINLYVSNRFKENFCGYVLINCFNVNLFSPIS